MFDLTTDWIPAFAGMTVNLIPLPSRSVVQVAEGYLTFNRLYQHSRVAFGNPSYETAPACTTPGANGNKMSREMEDKH
jgi:hypothetical protein